MFIAQTLFVFCFAPSPRCSSRITRSPGNAHSSVRDRVYRPDQVVWECKQNVPIHLLTVLQFQSSVFGIPNNHINTWRYILDWYFIPIRCILTRNFGTKSPDFRLSKIPLQTAWWNYRQRGWHHVTALGFWEHDWPNRTTCTHQLRGIVLSVDNCTVDFILIENSCVKCRQIQLLYMNYTLQRHYTSFK